MSVRVLGGSSRLVEVSVELLGGPIRLVEEFVGLNLSFSPSRLVEGSAGLLGVPPSQ